MGYELGVLNASESWSGNRTVAVLFLSLEQPASGLHAFPTRLVNWQELQQCMGTSNLCQA